MIQGSQEDQTKITKLPLSRSPPPRERSRSRSGASRRRQTRKVVLGVRAVVLQQGLLG